MDSTDHQAITENHDCSVTTFSGCGQCSRCRRRLNDTTVSHLTPDATRLSRSGLRILQGGSYNPQTLPEMFISEFDEHSFSIQKEAKTRWTIWVDWVNNKTGPLPPSKALHKPKEMTKILDDFFFQGALRRYTELNLINLDHLGQSGPTSWNKIPYVEIRGRRSASLEFGCCLARKLPLRRRLAHTDTIEILSTMLRELAFAVFAVFECQSCRMCDNIGSEGHGEPWMRLCQAMEDTANQNFVGLGTWRLC